MNLNYSRKVVVTELRYTSVENYEHILAKPLERLIANRIAFEAESLGFLDDAQYGGRVLVAMNKINLEPHFWTRSRMKG
jgi:hypothetical protein